MSPNISMDQNSMPLEVLLLEALATFQELKSHMWLPYWAVETYISILTGSPTEQRVSGQQSLESPVSV